MQAVSDEQLIDWVAKGDSSCLGTLFERHNKAVYQFCRQMTRNAAVAEDLVQETLLRILSRASTYKGQGSFKAWMFNIARNASLDYLRKHKHRGEPEPVDEEALVENRSAEQSAAGNQALDVLAGALARLPAAAREVIWLGRFEFDSYEELGLALGCKPATARVKMHRAMQQLNSEFAAINGAPVDV